MSDFDAERWGPLSFPIYYGGPFYRVWINPVTQFALATFATILILLGTYNFILYVWSFIKPGKLQAYCHAETGSWALVTGASDGIGRAFVEEFLDRGFNTLLHGRNQEKLQRIQKELAKKFPKRSIDWVVADASRSDNPETAVVEKVKDLPGKLVVLVNNVGGVNTYPQYLNLEDVSSADVDTQINTNTRFPTQLTRALLPTLLQNKPALILNCGSVAGDFGVPYITTYSATKGYIHSFTKALKHELLAEDRAKDIEVIAFVIANVRSAGNTDEMWPFTIDASDCAKGCLAKVGGGQTLTYASWIHAVQVGMMSMMPQKMFESAFLPEMRKRKEKAQKVQ